MISQADLAAPDVVAARLEGVDRVLHLAGVNQGDPTEVVAGNVKAAVALARGLRRCARQPGSVVFANSVLAGNGTPYGDSKAMAAATLADARPDLQDVRLPNLYGEHGRPFRNGVTATFCGLLADGRLPEVHEERELTLVHVTDAAARLLGTPASGPWDAAMPGLAITVPELSRRLAGYAATYRSGNLPSLTDRHAVRLFNTYRSHLVPSRHLLLARRQTADEAFRAVTAGAPGEVVRSTMRPGGCQVGRFHLATVRRILVLHGVAEILLRRVGHQAVVRLTVAGEEEVVVDVPTMWEYEIANSGVGELVMLTWTNAVMDQSCLDIYPSAGAAQQRGLVPVVA
ncbi:capsular biosynthesis protein [Micromonospora sp. KC606]|uniref:polysaccharide biosynthesis C-terminal domain-containing protein n=1 Tax=Micromonospora sp. KC606 TaxID=2530379 RepID=UPI001FB6E9D5|nr:capsular biosynthesis protein [Micromonospora sp. KC606]